VSTWITRIDTTGSGPRVAVKDNIDVVGVPTTAGCRALADAALPPPRDAALLAGARSAGARIVGKTNLTELARSATGINDWYGAPVNPADPTRLPGGSSSGSAAAVGAGEADVALGSDTAGSIRIPSACCGTTGLKTTHGRISLEGVVLLAPSLDVVGPMARDVAGVRLGMELLEPGFTPAPSAAATLGRLRRPGVDPAIDEAVDRVLRESGIPGVDIELPGWDAATAAALLLLLAEGWELHQHLVGDPGVQERVSQQIALGGHCTPAQVADAHAVAVQWRAELDSVFGQVEAIALPTLPERAPLLSDAAADHRLVQHMAPVNLAGVPALAMPVPADGFVTSVQLIGRHGAEELLITTGQELERAATV
jgi:amidase